MILFIKKKQNNNLIIPQPITKIVVGTVNSIQE